MTIDKKGKLNTNRHRKRVRKSIDKKRKTAEDKNKERYGDVEHGSKVIQRYKSDIVRAPAYRPERLNRGGYHSTYPVQNHIDKVKTIEQLFGEAQQRQANIDVFKQLYNRVDSGQIGNVSDETKESIARLRVAQEVNKHKQQKKEADNEALRIAQEIGADAFIDGHKKTQLKSREQLENLKFKYERDTKNAKDQQQVLQEALTQRSERKRIKKQNTDMSRQIEDEIKENYEPLIGTGKRKTPEQKKQEELMNAEIDKFKRNPELYCNDLKRSIDNHTKLTGELNAIRQHLASKREALKLFNDTKTELAAMEIEDPRLARAMTDILKRHGSPEQIVDAIKKLTDTAQETHDKLAKEYADSKRKYKTIAAAMEKNEKETEQLRLDMIDKLQSEACWEHLSSKAQDELEYMGIHQVLEEANGVTKSMHEWNKDKKEEWLAYIENMEREVEAHSDFARKENFCYNLLNKADNIIKGYEDVPDDWQED